MEEFWSREWELNPRPADYESAALPLSYLGFDQQNTGVNYDLDRLLFHSLYQTCIAARDLPHGFLHVI